MFQWSRSPGKSGSHFHPYSDLFSPNERKEVTVSTVCWLLMFSLLLYLSFTASPLLILKLYGVPYWVKLHSFLIAFLLKRYCDNVILLNVSLTKFTTFHHDSTKFTVDLNTVLHLIIICLY